MSAVLACIHPADRERFERTLREAHSSNVARFEASFRILRASDGAERWISLSSWRTSRADNSMRRIITTVRDVTDEKTAEERVRWSASHDPLTRLANRGLFQEKLDEAIRAAACNSGAVGLLFLPRQMLQLVINDPWFAWLHALSELIVRIDQAVEHESPATTTDALALVESTERLLTASETGDGFSRRYFEALQRQPAVVVAHSQVRRAIREMK